MFDIWFENDQKKKEYACQTSWGFSTRSIGAMVMIHGDDKGLVLPPRVAQLQVVIVPIHAKDDQGKIEELCTKVEKQLKDANIRVKVDNRPNYKPGWKFNHWEVKGVPIRLEIGTKDVSKNEVRVVRRFDGEKYQLSVEGLEAKLTEELENIHKMMYQKALKEREGRYIQANDWETFMTELNQRNCLLTPWCDVQACEQDVKKRSKEESKAAESETEEALTGSAKTLCKPLDQPQLAEGTKCFACGQPAKVTALWGRSY